MNTTSTNVGVTQLLRIAAVLWLVYLVTLAAIGLHLSPSPESVQLRVEQLPSEVREQLPEDFAQQLQAKLQEPSFQYTYFLVNGLAALTILGLACWPWAQDRLGRAFLPLMIVLMTVFPVIGKYVQGSTIQDSPIVLAGGTVVLLMALVLTAWQYRWRHVVMFCLGMAGLDLVIGLVLVPPSIFAFVLALSTVLQTIVLLVVGYFINTLMQQIRLQQESLELANVQLRRHVGTLEHLTISRERNRMARELHDTLAHTLSALSVQLETVKAYWDVDSVTAQGLLDKSLDATRSGLQETRRALKSLRASPLEDLGLNLALRRLAESASIRANLVLDLSLPGENLPLAPDAEQCIYRVAQEAIANVTHHANATHLMLHLTRDANIISLRVQDDGLGFDVSSREDLEHFGLPGMRERAEIAGGKLAVASSPGQGTTIELTLQRDV